MTKRLILLALTAQLFVEVDLRAEYPVDRPARKTPAAAEGFYIIHPNQPKQVIRGLGFERELDCIAPVLADPGRRSLVDALVIHHIGSDAKQVLAQVPKLRTKYGNEKPLFQNEYEYLAGAVSQHRAAHHELVSGGRSADMVLASRAQADQKQAGQRLLARLLASGSRYDRCGPS